MPSIAYQFSLHFSALLTVEFLRGNLPLFLPHTRYASKMFVNQSFIIRKDPKMKRAQNAVKIPIELARQQALPLPSGQQTTTQHELEIVDGKMRSKMRLLAILIVLYV